MSPLALLPASPALGPAPVFDNPLLPAPSQDPWVTWHAGEFLAATTNGRRVFLRRSRDAASVFRAPAVCIWTAPRSGPYSRHLWAPELHRAGGGWLVYFAADNGRNRSHRVWVLESSGDDPAGRYKVRGRLETGGWAIDATLLPDDQAGRTHVVWSGWEDDAPGAQNLYLAPLRDAATLAGPRVRIGTPTQDWERYGAPVCEGPAVLRRGGVTCIVYAASASWTIRACLGLLVNRDGDYLNPRSWKKFGPVFPSTAAVWGVGHCSFVRDPGSGLDLIFYHAKSRRRRGWRDRHIRAQAFKWTTDGLPDFGWPAVAAADPG